jgi:hypothetical protein
MPVPGVAKLAKAPRVNHFVQQRLFERFGILAEMLGRQLDQQRTAVRDAAG